MSWEVMGLLPFIGTPINNIKEGNYMLKSILNTHRVMMYEFMEVTGLDDYGLAWFCFMKGVIFASIIVWIF